MSKENVTGGTQQGLSLKGNGIILLDMALMAMMVMFVEIMLVPALPIIAQEFPEDAHWVSWVLAAYMLVGAVATPLLGRMGDLYGKKRIMIIAMTVYLLGLIGCAFSWSIPSLIAFRAVQGVGMGMFSLAFGIVRDTFPTRTIPVAMGIISAMFSVGVSIGLLGGGFIVQTFSWRDCYYIVTPLLALLVILAWKTIKDDKIESNSGLDLPGSALLGISVFLLLLSLTQGEDWGYTDWKTLGMMAASIIGFASFITWEKRTATPIVRLKLLMNQGVLGANLVALFMGLSMFLLFQTIPFFLRSPESLGGFGIDDAFVIGLFMFPSALTQLFFAPAAGAWSKRIGADKILSIGMGISTLAIVMLIMWHGQDWQIWASQAVFGIGMGMSMVSLINVIAMSAPRAEFGIASGMNTLFRVIGGSVGPVLAAAMMSSYAVMVTLPGYTFPIEMTSEQGFVITWIIGGIFAAIGLVIAVVLRPGKGMKYED
jgi:MFS family permease